MTSRLNIVVLGGGGREHALVSACARSPRCGKLYAVPGNPGIAQKAECHALSVTDGATLAAFCEDRQIDLAIVGPEGPLRSTSTAENLQFSRALLAARGMGTEQPVLVVTSDFHQLRARLIARRVGFIQVSSAGAATPLYLRYNAYLREYFAFISGWLLGEY